MQAIERIDISNSWLTLLFIFLLALLVVIKMINQPKLYEYSRAYFLKGFVIKKIEERKSFFSTFNLLMYVFSILVFSIFLLFLINFVQPSFLLKLINYLKVAGVIAIYFSLFLIVDFVLVRVFEIKNEAANFIASKVGYFYNAALVLFPFLIINTFSFSSIYIIFGVFIMLFLISSVLIFTNNKNLILSKLFYFILYLCALEIAPLLIIYKVTV